MFSSSPEHCTSLWPWLKCILNVLDSLSYQNCSLIQYSKVVEISPVQHFPEILQVCSLFLIQIMKQFNGIVVRTELCGIIFAVPAPLTVS